MGKITLNAFAEKALRQLMRRVEVEGRKQITRAKAHYTPLSVSRKETRIANKRRDRRLRKKT
jgi:ribosomal protein S21